MEASAKEGTFWQDDTPKDQSYAPLSSTILKDFGLGKENSRFVMTLDELRKSPPNIVVAKAIRRFGFVQNWFKKQELEKDKSYVMGLGVYQQLQSAGSKYLKNQQNKKLLKPSPIKFKNVYNPYEGQDLTDKTLLVFRTGGIGDLLFIQPNLSYLKSKYPSCKIIFACGPQYQPMVENWECVDEVTDLPFTLSKLREADYHALFEGVIERCREAETVNAFVLFTRWMGLNLPIEMLRPRQFPKEDKLDECMKLLDEWKLTNQKFIVTQLRASSPIRTPRPSIWLKLIDELTDRGFNILITDNPRQTEFVDLFIKDAKNKDKVFNFCSHSKSIDYTIAITSLASLVITTDSALGHIAESVGTRGYGLYGPFPAEIRLSTYPGFKWVNAVRDCAPCFIHSPKPCPKAGSDGFSPCYDNLNITQIIEDIEGMLQ